jgi:Domain of unknown function (DUF1905)
MKLEFRGELWRWQGDAPAAWYFITVPIDLSLDLREVGKFLRLSMGMIPVQVQIGKTVWKTSLFPKAKEQTYLLPVKASVRKSEKLEVGVVVQVMLEPAV